MTPAWRIPLLCGVGGALLAAGYGYSARVERQSDVEFFSRSPLPRGAPQGPPREVALLFLHSAVAAGWWDQPVPAAVHSVVRDAPWGDTLPSRTEFDAAVDAAAQACDGTSAGRAWLADLEFFGGLQASFRSSQRPFNVAVEQGNRGYRDTLPREPFVQSAMFGTPHQPGNAHAFLLAVEPASCALGGRRLAATYGGRVVSLDVADPTTQATLARSRLLAQHADAFRRNDATTLAPLLAEADAFLAHEIVRALARSRDAAAIPALRALHDIAEGEMRFLTALALAEVGDREVEPALRSYLDIADDPYGYGTVHYRAILALGRLGAADVREELQMMAEWEDPELMPLEAQAVLREFDRHGSS